MKRLTALATLLFALWGVLAEATEVGSVEQWGVFEVALPGPSVGNPFVDVRLNGRFEQGDVVHEVAGFYDGDGKYRIRFMPERTGRWRYRTSSNVPELHGQTGAFTAGPPRPGNHGLVRVAHKYHFAYADGLPFRPLGTTCYAWTHQSDEMQRQTLETLAKTPFNKLRMCVFPKRYKWSTNEPPLYPFEGTPPRDWNRSRFNPAFFQALERRVLDMQKLGIEADLILFHPYDEGHWGFDRMSAEEDDRYLTYVVARLAAFRNVWWSLANEWDFMKEKRESDFERFGRLVHQLDPYRHLLSIHNGKEISNHTREWITHASIQNGSAVEDPARAILYRDVIRKPIVYDEIKYEGNLPKRWGNLSAEELVHRFWQATIAGTYATHGETYLDRDNKIWWAAGGKLHGQSPARLAFLKQVLEVGPNAGIEPIDKWQNANYGGVGGQFYLISFGREAPRRWKFQLPKSPQADELQLKDGMRFQAELLDTWNMTTTEIPGEFTLKRVSEYFWADINDRDIELPGKSWLCLRLRRIE